MSESFWSRLKKARLFQIVAVYLGASWGVLQATVTLRDALDLPDWVPPVAVILLAVGLLVILATAWVQAHPVTRGREAADEVPSGWELGLHELREAVTEGRLPHLTWARALVGGVFLFSLLFGVAGLYVVIQDRGRSFTPEPLVAAEAAPGIAVMPFSTSGAELEAWKEGLVTLMSTGLDGAGGLRAIDSRTVLAQWDQRVGAGQRADLETTLRVARAGGARYALVGSAVAIGSDLRLVADVYEVDGGEALGQAQVEGSTEAPHELVDRLAIEVLEVLAQEGPAELARVDLAAVTTTSIPALKAFLEGESHFRHSDFGAAIEDYTRAVEEDSTFAFAYYRLYSAYGWGEQGNPLMGRYKRKAVAHSDRLPERERRLVWADSRADDEDPAGLDSLRAAVRSYPDDSEAWYLLGEAYFHGQVPVPPEEVGGAFRRAAELDPTFAPYRIHLVDLGFLRRADTALARREVDRYRELAGEGGEFVREWRTALKVLRGEPGFRVGSADSLAAMDLPMLRRVAGSLNHPRFLDRRLHVLRVALEAHREEARSGGHYGVLVETLARTGRIAEAVAELDSLRRRGDVQQWACRTMVAATSGYPVPPEHVREVLEATDSGPGSGEGCRAFLAAEVGDREAYDRAMGVVSSTVDSVEAAGDSVETAEGKEFLALLAAYWAWRQEGRPEALAGHFAERVFLAPFPPWWAGRALAEAGRVEEALHAYSHDRANPMSHLQVARIHDAAGRRGPARRAYRSALAAWSEADPAMEPFVSEAREALARLENDG